MYFVVLLQKKKCTNCDAENMKYGHRQQLLLQGIRPSLGILSVAGEGS